MAKDGKLQVTVVNDGSKDFSLNEIAKDEVSFSIEEDTVAKQINKLGKVKKVLAIIQEEEKVNLSAIDEESYQLDVNRSSITKC